MNEVEGSAVHVRIIIVLEWKMVAAVGCLILIRLLMK